MIKEELANVDFFPLRKHNLHYMRDPAVAAKEIRASKQACKKRSYKSARAFISSFFVRNKKCQPNRRRRDLQRELQPDAAGSISSSGGERRRDGPVGGGKTLVVSFARRPPPPPLHVWCLAAPSGGGHIVPTCI